MKKAFIILLLIIVTLVLLLQVDDSINPEAQKMYDSVRQGKENKAYFYLKGIRASIGEEPEIVGRSLFEAEMKARKAGLFYEEAYPEEKKLPAFKLSKDNENKSGNDAIAELFAHKLAQNFTPNKLTKEELVLWQRYKTFINLKGYQTPMVLTLSSPSSPYQTIIQGNEINSLQAIYRAKEDVNAAKKLLLEDISLLRYQLEQADDLVSKIFYEAAISSDLDVLSILLHKYNKKLAMEVAPLSQKERSLVKVMSAHFATGYELYKGMKRQSNILSEKVKLPSFVVRALFKPNMTINALYTEPQNVMKNSLLPLKDFMKVSQDKVKIPPSFIQRTRNSIGSILVSIEGPSYNQYISRIFSLDAKILLLNKIASKSGDSIDISTIVNPFYSDKTAHYSKDKKAICFDVPYQDILRIKTRCLRIEE